MRKLFVGLFIIVSIFGFKPTETPEYSDHEILMWTTKASEAFVDHIHLVDGKRHIGFGYNIEANGMGRVYKYLDKNGKISIDNASKLMSEFYTEEVDPVFTQYTVKLKPNEKLGLKMRAYNTGIKSISKGSRIYKQIHAKQPPTDMKSCCKGSCKFASHKPRRVLEYAVFTGNWAVANPEIRRAKKIAGNQYSIAAKSKTTPKPKTKQVNVKPKQKKK